MNLPGDSQVAGDDGQCRQDCAQEEHAQDEGEAVGGVVEFAPGYCTGDAKWLGAVVAPAYQGQNGPEQGVEPDESDQDADSVLGDFVTCKKEEESVYTVLTSAMWVLPRGLQQKDAHYRSAWAAAAVPQWVFLRNQTGRVHGLGET